MVTMPLGQAKRRSGSCSWDLEQPHRCWRQLQLQVGPIIICQRVDNDNEMIKMDVTLRHCCKKSCVRVLLLVREIYVAKRMVTKIEIIIIPALPWTEWRGRSLASLELWREVTATPALRENWSPLLFELSYKLFWSILFKTDFQKHNSTPLLQ